MTRVVCTELNSTVLDNHDCTPQLAWAMLNTIRLRRTTTTLRYNTCRPSRLVWSMLNQIPLPRAAVIALSCLHDAHHPIIIALVDSGSFGNWCSY